VVRAADLYLAGIAGRIRLVGLDVGFNTLLRRLGPARWRTRPTADAVIDWASVHAFGAAVGSGVQLARHRTELSRLRPAELADLLEDLGRAQRQELLDAVEPDAAADAIEEMRPDKVHQLLMDTDPAEAAGYLARMEPDEAADALRDIDDQTRTRILAAMPSDASTAVAAVLEHGEDTAGGIMTSVVVTARDNERVRDVRDRLRGQAGHLVDLDALVIVDADGRLVDDVSTIELLLADPATRLGELVGPPWPVTVTPTTPVREVAERLIDARRLSVVVLDDQHRPIGRILADDIIDTLIPNRGRFRLARLQ
jgi:Mg/Co/Ni transporter MgtE